MTSEVDAYQAPTAKAAKDILRASRWATQSLAVDILRMLGSRAPTPAELTAVLDMPADASCHAYLMGAAQRLPEPLRSQWLERLSNPATVWRITNRRAVDLRQRMAAAEIAEAASGTLRPLVNTTVEEACRRAAFDASKAAGVAIRFDMIPRRQIEEVVRGTAFERYSRHLGTRVAREARAVVMEGLLAGQGSEDIARGVSIVTGKSISNTRTLVRTTLNAAANDAKRREYARMGIDRVRFLCTLDERTCRQCGPLDGREFPLDDAPRLPVHPNCRCLVVSVVPEREGRMRRARDADGRSITVPASMTYDEWRRKYGDGVRGVDGLASIKDAFP